MFERQKANKAPFLANKKAVSKACFFEGVFNFN
jgi:hypothetical protein